MQSNFIPVVPVPVYFDGSSPNGVPTGFPSGFVAVSPPAYPYPLYVNSFGPPPPFMVTPSAPPQYTSNSIFPPSYSIASPPSARSNALEMTTISTSSKPSSSSKSTPSRSTTKPKETPTIFSTSPLVIDQSQQVTPSIEAYGIQSMKCRKCSKFYKGDENAFDSCRFHSGRFASAYKSTLGMGCITAWNCCRSLERNAPGCKIGRHLECTATSAALMKFTQAMETSERKRETEKFNLRQNQRTPSSNSLIDLSSDIGKEPSSGAGINFTPQSSSGNSLYPSLQAEDERFVKASEQTFIKHNVSMTDTLSGLSIRYNVQVDEIKSANKLTKDEDIWTRFQILIPFRGQEVKDLDVKDKKQWKKDMKARLIKRFRRNAGCGDNEAKYYLKGNNWDFEQSFKEFKDDLIWEKTNPPKNPLSKKM